MVVKNNTMATELWSLFCVGKYPNVTCDEYFILNNLTELQAIPGLLSGVIKGEKLSSSLFHLVPNEFPHRMNPDVHPADDAFLHLSVFPLDNLWGDYGPARGLIEKKSQPSAQAQETPTDIYKPYVFNDITTYFTLLVGIYFPSVTGR